MACAIPRSWVGWLLAAGLGLAAWLVWRCERDPAVAFLPNHAPAAWIVYPNAPDILAHAAARPGVERATVFRRQFTLESAPKVSGLEVRALDGFAIRLNDQPVPAPQPPNWKDPSRIDVAQWLVAGTNRVEVTVSNVAGPPALWLALPLNDQTLTSDQAWEASYANGSWQPARLAANPPAIRPGNPMYCPTSPLAAAQRRARTHVAFLIAALGFAAMVTGRLRKAATPDADPEPSGSNTIMVVVAVGVMWAILFWNNARLIPAGIGFDVQHHLNYIDYIQQHWALPPIHAGWETHQPPLYYFLAAVYLKALGLKAATAGGILALRALSLAFGLGQLVLVFASLRLLFPGEWRRPLFGMVMAGFLPAHLYHASYITNETLFALLTTASFYLFFRLCRNERLDPRGCAWLGLAVAATLLAKLTALVLAPLVLIALFVALLTRRERRARVWVSSLGTCLAICLVVSGWYYWRLWTGPGPVGDQGQQWSYGPGGWWQEDGFRTASYYLRCGQALVHPLYSGFHGFWDGLYSTVWGDGLCGGAEGIDNMPPWELNLLLAGYWLALAPSVCVLLGLGAVLGHLVRRPTLEWLLLAGVALLFALAQVHVSLVAPGTSQVRASFALLLLLPFCASFAIGLDALIRRSRWLGFAATAITVWWALTSYTAHFVSPRSAAVQLEQAQALIQQGRFAEAARHAEAGLSLDPSRSRLRSILADCWNQTGRSADAARLVLEAVTLFPADPMAHLDLAFDLARANRLDQATEQIEEALRHAPDHPIAAREWVALLVRQGRFPEALDACRNALRIRPHHPELQTWFKSLDEGRPPPDIAPGL